jgi:Pentapeptide repeats (8 copies)
MDQKQALHKSVDLLLDKAQGATVSELASAVEKATGAMKLSSDLEKSQAELRKLALEETKLGYENATAEKRQRSESLKDYVALLAPFVTVLTLAATLIVGGWEFRQTEKDKAAAAEDAQWADAIKVISQSSKLSPGVIALNPFLKSPRYATLARETAVQLLANSSDRALFTDLYGAAFVPVGWDNLAQVIRLDKALKARGSPLWEKTYDRTTDTNDPKKLTPEEKEIVEYVNVALSEICSQVGSVLKGRPSGTALDLSGARFWSCDWSGADLSGANIDGLELASVDLRGASLGYIVHFENTYFYNVPWWEAKNISPKLLEYLEHDPDCEYKESKTYGPRGDKVSQQQYAAAMARLRQSEL